MRQAHVAAIGVTALASLGAGAAAYWWHCSKAWNDWLIFSETFIQSDGRVIDYLVDDRSTSEGQAYAMFFALVANDRDRFELILKWTENNLSDGDMSRNLPAWLWGRGDSGRWTVVDDNPASDADLWIAFSLLEAGRLWDEKGYVSLANDMLELIAEQSVTEIPDVGKVLLPAPVGFVKDPDVWRLNPSYVPAFLFARLAAHDPDGPWREIAASHASLLAEAAVKGFAPDWLTYQAGIGLVEDEQSGWTGAYEAIRVYLWSGLFPDSRPRPESLMGMARVIRETGQVPETVDTRTGEVSGEAPPGFYGALRPYLAALGEAGLGDGATDMLNAGGSRPRADEPQYYDHVLYLFGQGWADKKYRVVENGRIKTFWSRSCCELYH